jgi:hypothetical protein
MFLLPWWAVFVFGFFGALMFQYYFEIILIGIAYDLIFNISMVSWYQSGWHTLIAIGIFIISVLFGKIIRK